MRIWLGGALETLRREPRGLPICGIIGQGFWHPGWAIHKLRAPQGSLSSESKWGPLDSSSLVKVALGGAEAVGCAKRTYSLANYPLLLAALQSVKVHLPVQWRKGLEAKLALSTFPRFFIFPSPQDLQCELWNPGTTPNSSTGVSLTV